MARVPPEALDDPTDSDEHQPTPHRLLEVIGAASPIFYCVDTRGVFTLATGHDLEALGLSPDILVGRLLSDFVGIESSLWAGYQHALTGEPHLCTVEIGESTYDVRHAPVVDEAGRVTGATAVFTDQSERSAAEAALRKSEAQFRALIEALPDAVFVHRFGRIIYANRSAVDLLHMTGDSELLGRPLIEIFPPEERAAAAEALRTIEVEGGRRTDRLRLCRADESLGDVEITTMPLVFDGRSALACVARDVTAWLVMQRQILQTERLACLGTLTAGVSHEINNPLAYMFTNLSFVTEELEHLLSGGSIEAADVVDALRDVRYGAERVREIVKQLAALTRADETTLAPLDVRDVLDQALCLTWNRLCRVARVRVLYESAGPTMAKAGRLGQVFLNLLLNAEQFLSSRDSGGRAGEIELRCAVEDDELVVRIADNGPGMSPDVVKNIFDPFFTTKPVGQGTGLGLSVAHSIVGECGGTIAVDTAPEQGAAFVVRLPLCGSAYSNGGTDLRVLVVEDEIESIATILRSFRGSELLLMAAGSPTTALADALRENTWSLVLATHSAVATTEAELEARLADARLVSLVPRGLRPSRGSSSPSLNKPVVAKELQELVDALSST